MIKPIFANSLNSFNCMNSKSFVIPESGIIKLIDFYIDTDVKIVGFVKTISINPKRSEFYFNPSKLEILFNKKDSGRKVKIFFRRSYNK